MGFAGVCHIISVPSDISPVIRSQFKLLTPAWGPSQAHLAPLSCSVTALRPRRASLEQTHLRQPSALSLALLAFLGHPPTQGSFLSFRSQLTCRLLP